MNLIISRPQGLYCVPGDFYIDPSYGVERAVITHAHGDHARTGSEHYLATAASEHVLQSRLGNIKLQTLNYGQQIKIKDTTVSLHPAGHVLGSAQVRVEYRGEIWVASGDYKLAPDPTCSPFESVRCHTFITESTFGLPIYRWPQNEEITQQIALWWQSNAANGRASVLFCYSFGKAQRLLAMLAHYYDADKGCCESDKTPHDQITENSMLNNTFSGAFPGPIYCHGAVNTLNNAYRAAGVALPFTQYVSDDIRNHTGSHTPSAASKKQAKTNANHLKQEIKATDENQLSENQLIQSALETDNRSENIDSHLTEKYNKPKSTHNQTKTNYSQALILAPPSAAGSTWLRRFGDYSDGFASGWMAVRGARRRRGVDRGFVLSDHADWPSLNQAIDASGAQQIIVTHGQIAALVRWLKEKGLDAKSFTRESKSFEEDDS